MRPTFLHHQKGWIKSDSCCRNTIEDSNKRNVPAGLLAVGPFHNFQEENGLVLGNHSLLFAQIFIGSAKCWWNTMELRDS
jgi:hypothetical protein